MDPNTENEPQINADVRRLEWVRGSRLRVYHYGKVSDIIRPNVALLGGVIEAQAEICVNLRPSAVRF